MTNRTALVLPIILAFTVPAYSAEQIIEEIVVTAQKREQSLNEVGIAVSALTGDDIREQGFDDPLDIANAIPGLATAVSTGVPVFAIRGVGLDDFNANNTSGVGTYIDDVYISSPVMMEFQLFDLERLEVLKGPQGTLYGRNTTGGAINFISRRPTDEFQAYAELDYGRWGRLKLTGAAGGPISDSARWRVAGQFLNQREGFQDDVSNGGESGKPEKWALRAMLEFDLSDRADLLLNLHGGKDESVNWHWQADDNFGLDPTTLALFGTTVSSPGENDKAAGGPGFVSVGGPTSPERDDDTIGAAVTLNVDLNFATLTSITSFDSYDRENFDAIDGSPSIINDIAFKSDIEQVSQELRLTSNSDSNVTWVGGLYYYADEIDTQDRVLITNAIDLLYLDLGLTFADTPTGLGLPSTLTSTYEQKTDAFGMFGHVEWFFSDEWKLTLGARYSTEEKSFDGIATDDQGFVAATPGPAVLAALDDSERDSNFSGKIGLDYLPNDDLLVYGSVTTGFKSGVYYSNVVTTPEAWGFTDAEQMTAFELGFKQTFAGGSAHLNGALFFYDYKDKQFLAQLVTPAGVIAALGNVPESENIGAELDLLWQPIAGLELKAGIAYLETEVKNAPRDIRGIPFVGAVTNGGELSFAPELSYSLLGRYAWALANELELALQLNYAHKDTMISVLGDTVADTDDYDEIGARVSLGAVDGRWEVALWGRNLADDDAVTYGYTNFLGDRSYSLQQPLSYGMTLLISM